MRLPVIFRWIDEQGHNSQGAGFTRDISTAGLFVYSATPPPADAAVHLEVLLPLHEGGQGTRLEGLGQVIRIEGKGERAGFAATSDFGLDHSFVQ